MKFKYLFLILLISLLLIGCAKEIAEKQSSVAEEEPTISATPQQPVETPAVPEELPETTAGPGETPEEVAGPEGKIHVVEAITKGFSPKELTIKVGDTIEWKNVRTGRLNKVMILGTINCLNIKSKILNTGESFNWTFDQPQNCTFVDGITTSYLFKLKVE